MNEERGIRKVRIGEVISAAGDKTIVVRVDRQFPHPIYKKFIHKSKKFHAHDEENSCGKGDIVKIQETRPYSKLKCWRLVEIVEKAR